MVNFFLKHKINKITSIAPSLDDIKNSRRILFSIFTRYGDTIIDIVVIREFIKLYPDKDYLILCPRQMKPYITELLPNIECLAINKRNIIDMLKVTLLLKKRVFDIGFNPWSNGLDSCYFISYCNKFLFYKDFQNKKAVNHYQVVRLYLNLPKKDWLIKKLVLQENYKNILICPQSTDVTRSITPPEVKALIASFKNMYTRPKITIASMNRSYLSASCNNFLFEKTEISSKKFITLTKKSDLIVCADSGPLHIGLAFKKDLIALMKTTFPETVINSGSRLRIE
tara:strand:+ start:481 stop:1329 length:849 start_codon:yes stop_codon:yes gene_type:complete